MSHRIITGNEREFQLVLYWQDQKPPPNLYIMKSASRSYISPDEIEKAIPLGSVDMVRVIEFVDLVNKNHEEARDRQATYRYYQAMLDIALNLIDSIIGQVGYWKTGDVPKRVLDAEKARVDIEALRFEDFMEQKRDGS